MPEMYAAVIVLAVIALVVWETEGAEEAADDGHGN